MSFDKETRNLLAKTVAACRRRLTEDVTDQLRGTFGLHPDGTVLPLEKLTHLTEEQAAAARRLRELLDHYAAGAAGTPSARRKAAYERLVLEISFTALNRLAALRLCEERGLVVECVRKGTASDGFRLFERVSGGALGTRYETYRVFLECLFDELALDLGVLFDRFTPQSAVFPGERCLEEVLDELNKPDLAHLWTEDETIGWIYQYFNPPEERKAMREASQAPRNSRELAVRNQFFTPRYVVEFLTDNTLGRIWYEMRKGETRLKEECRYLVRRPNEVFLDAGEKAPPRDDADGDLSQEELLKQPVYIEHRPKKDPRGIKILDPACGSGHFLLYAFDLLETIYEEAWEDPESPASEVTGRTLREEFETLDELRRNVPKLIIEHNLHGIDIDPRAVQIAALALWLRAQKTWKRLGLKPAERPRVRKSNIVTAEPMPREEDMRREFIEALRPKVLGQLTAVVFDKMKLASEAGSLLKIEEEIRDAVAEAKKQWLEGPKPEQAVLFPELVEPKPEQRTLFDVKEITDEEFWNQAEERILTALKEYAERAENGRVLRRRLFAEDAARGFAFVDLCRKRFDVVLMNPPFGAASSAAKAYTDLAYPLSKEDIDAAFVFRALDFSNELGLAGAITNRTILLKATLEDWRRVVCFGRGQLSILADFGLGVLDGALVEAAAYTIGAVRNNPSSTIFAVRLMRSSDKGQDLLATINTLKASGDAEIYLASTNALSQSPAARLAYFATRRQQAWFRDFTTCNDHGFLVRQGLITGDNFRFLRLRWEVPLKEVGTTWFVFDKGGEYSPYFNDIHLFVNWLNDGKEIKNFFSSSGRIASRPQNTGFYFRRGITYPRRTGSNASFQLFPEGAIFDAQAPLIAIPDDSKERILAVAGVLNSRPIASLLELLIASADAVESASAARTYEVGIISSLPFPYINQRTCKHLSDLVLAAWNAIATRSNMFNEHVGNLGCFLRISPYSLTSLTDIARETLEQEEELLQRSFRATQAISETVNELFGVDEETKELIEGEFGIHPNCYPSKAPDKEELSQLYTLTDDELVDAVATERSSSRFVTKKAFWVDRRTELLCLHFECSPDAIFSVRRELGILPAGYLRNATMTLLGYCVGLIFGRWDVRIALDPSLAPKLPNPFDPLPVCPPGMLVGPDGLPAKPGGIVSEEWLRARPDANSLPPDGAVPHPTIPDSEYPLRINWDGILVDDPGFNGARPHRDDIVRRVREVLDLIWGDRAQEIEQEACEILGVRDLRDYFRKPSGFFQDHLKRYSKSRRKAPIYWPLSTASGSYTIWLYYHRLTDQTLYAAVNKYLEPKIAETERALDRLEEELAAASGREATRLRDRLSEGRAFLGELQDLREELLRVAGLPYKPDLNDGVIINAAPLHKLFRLRSWAKETEKVWEKLEKGDYDWAHMAYTIWPDRVREVCRRDRSIAIAHGLEDICEVEPPAPKKKGGRGRGRRRREAAR